MYFFTFNYFSRKLKLNLHLTNEEPRVKECIFWMMTSKKMEKTAKGRKRIENDLIDVGTDSEKPMEFCSQHPLLNSVVIGTQILVEL